MQYATYLHSIFKIIGKNYPKNFFPFFQILPNRGQQIILLNKKLRIRKNVINKKCAQYAVSAQIFYFVKFGRSVQKL